MKKIMCFVFFSMLISCVDMNEDCIKNNSEYNLDAKEESTRSVIDTTVPFYYEGEYHQIHYDSVRNIYYFY